MPSKIQRLLWKKHLNTLDEINLIKVMDKIKDQVRELEERIQSAHHLAHLQIVTLVYHWFNLHSTINQVLRCYKLLPKSLEIKLKRLKVIRYRKCLMAYTSIYNMTLKLLNAIYIALAKPASMNHDRKNQTIYSNTSSAKFHPLCMYPVHSFNGSVCIQYQTMSN